MSGQEIDAVEALFCTGRERKTFSYISPSCACMFDFFFVCHFLRVGKKHLKEKKDDIYSNELGVWMLM